MRESTDNIQRTIDLSRQLLSTADLSGLACAESRCSELYGFVRESAGKILNKAEQERTRLINREIWDKSRKSDSKQSPEMNRKIYL